MVKLYLIMIPIWLFYFIIIWPIKFVVFKIEECMCAYKLKQCNFDIPEENKKKALDFAEKVINTFNTNNLYDISIVDHEEIYNTINENGCNFESYKESKYLIGGITLFDIKTNTFNKILINKFYIETFGLIPEKFMKYCIMGIIFHEMAHVDQFYMYGIATTLKLRALESEYNYYERSILEIHAYLVQLIAPLKTDLI